MTPNILKSNVGGGAGHTPTSQPVSAPPNSGSSSNNSTNMDGDHTAKNMEQGANSVTKGATDMTEGLHESVNQVVCREQSCTRTTYLQEQRFADQVIRVQPATGEKATGHGTSMFSKDGAIGKQFAAEGAIGSTAQSVGGPLDKQGMIGKHFNADGSIGGAFQQMAEKNEQH